MPWREALVAMGFVPHGKVKGWQLSGDQLEVWYRVQNSSLSRGEIENLLGWAFGSPEWDPDEPDALAWPDQSMSARIHTEDEFTGAIVIRHGSSQPQNFSEYGLAMNFGAAETIH